MYREDIEQGGHCTGMTVYKEDIVQGGQCTKRTLYRVDTVQGEQWTRRTLYRVDSVQGGHCTGWILYREDSGHWTCHEGIQITCTKFQKGAKLATGSEATEQSAPIMNNSVSLPGPVTWSMKPLTANVPPHCNNEKHAVQYLITTCSVSSPRLLNYTHILLVRTYTSLDP